ncbi:GNAT family N-acetyltransferase [Ferroacidibacillus organovorans]|uniref:GCN5 family acetyltransferase n=1 Tax=Ferroacidibacillus organovorans TaxID=1765683 RepID=A0A853K8P1_9BACL|nr:GNAT family N-acetyltransferase [Ferroacidibacillus organovorans]KYP80275.1 GCN5 family acetyltransferase [Ferroacidibacillus organovorans]OAG93243.1 GCN5 family acetyltransferase [Ferroacidibacillus organovorans]
MSHILIRPACSDDRDALTDLMDEYIVDFYKKSKQPRERIQDLITLLLDHRDGIQFVAQQNEELVGFATLYYSFSTLRAGKISIMNDLYVIEGARGSGVAAKLFDACHHYSKAHGCAFMSWTTASDNIRAQRFYEKMGGTTGDWLNYSIE